MKFLTAILITFLLTPGLAAAGDEDYLNDLLANGGNVTIPAGVYVLNHPLILQSNTIISGEVGSNGELGVEFTIKDHAGWKSFVPLFQVNGVQNVTIENIIIDANRDNNLDVGDGGKAWGKGFYNCIHAIDSDNITVRNCILRNGLGDGYRTKSSTNIKFYNNVCYNLGHDAFYGVDSQNIECYRNQIETETDDGLRLWNSQHVRFHDNYITAGENPDGLSGNAGVQVEFSKAIENADIEICNNRFYRTWGSAFWLIAYGQGDGLNHGISIHHNLICQSPCTWSIDYAAGVTIYGANGITITNNVFDSAKNSAVSNQIGGSNVLIKDNIITNTREIEKPQEGNGYGIADRVGTSLSIEDNCFYNNGNGNLYSCTSKGDDLEDPKTHRTSSGWWWDSSVQAWACNFVAPLPLGQIAPTNTSGSKDTDTHDVMDVFYLMNMEYTNTSVIKQGIITPNVEWQSAGKYTQAWVDVPIHENTIKLRDVTYVKGDPKETALVMYGTKNVAEFPDGQTATKNVTVNGDNLTVKLDIQTKYKTQAKKVTTIRGHKFNTTNYKGKSETVTVEKNFSIPHQFPALKADDFNVTVTYYNYSHNPHTVVHYEAKNKENRKFVSEVYIVNERSSAIGHMLMGHVKRFINGVKITSYDEINIWKFSDDRMGYEYEGVRINGKIDNSTFRTVIKTPYDEFVVPYTYIEKRDNINLGQIGSSLVIGLVLFIMIRPALQDLQFSFGRWK